MRIIAGKWRGRRIEAPEHGDTRPILDRAKTVLFDVLGHRLARPGVLPAAAVLDLFAGSGALGIEAVSRGATYCLCVERDARTARVLRGNLDSLKIVDEVEVVEGDAVTGRWGRGGEGGRGRGGGVADGPEVGRYHLVFVDPPYRMLRGDGGGGSLKKLWERLGSDPVIGDDALIVVRHEREKGTGAVYQKRLPSPFPPLAEVDRRDVGTMTFRFLMRRHAVVDEPLPGRDAHGSG